MNEPRGITNILPCLFPQTWACNKAMLLAGFVDSAANPCRHSREDHPGRKERGGRAGERKREDLDALF